MTKPKNDFSRVGTTDGWFDVEAFFADVNLYAERRGMSLRQIALQAGIPYNTLRMAVKVGSLSLTMATRLSLFADLDLNVYRRGEW